MSKSMNEAETSTNVKIQRDNLNEGQRFIAFDQDPSPDIFKLDVDCCNILFDRLSLKDLYSIGQTCKRFNKIAALHLQEKYSAVRFHCIDGGIYFNDSQIIFFSHYYPFGMQVTAFAEFVQNVCISGPLDQFEYIEANCKSLKAIRIEHSSITTTKIDCIKSVLLKIEVIELYDCKFEGDFYDDFLKLCPELKKLRIDIHIESNIWLHQKYPKLEHVSNEINYQTKGRKHFDDWRSFFEQNQNVHTFECHSSFLLHYADLWLKSNVKLNRLIVHYGSKSLLNVCDLLDRLYERGFYRKLHLEADIENQQEINKVATLRGLDTLHANFRVQNRPSIVVPTFLNVKTLATKTTYTSDSDDTYWPDFSSNPQTLLPNVERIHCTGAHLHEILPFIKHLKQLKEIEIDAMVFPSTDMTPAHLMEWNMEREKLNGARKLTIYIDYNDLLTLKAANVKTNYNLIEIKSHLEFHC